MFLMVFFTELRLIHLYTGSAKVRDRLHALNSDMTGDKLYLGWAAKCANLLRGHEQNIAKNCKSSPATQRRHSDKFQEEVQAKRFTPRFWLQNGSRVDETGQRNWCKSVAFHNAWLLVTLVAGLPFWKHCALLFAAQILRNHPTQLLCQ